MNKCGVVRCVFQAAFGCIDGCGSNISSVGAGPEQADYILPFPRPREPAEPCVTHAPLMVRRGTGELSRLGRWNPCGEAMKGG